MAPTYKKITSNTKQESLRVGVEPAIPVFKVEELIQCATEFVGIVGDK